jgi:protein-L-isoaspartate(D-aspartate) O-methyltransferase
MTNLAAPAAGDKVLEIGTGSGYQAAVIGQLVERVYSLEIIAPLASQAAETLQRLKYKNIMSKNGDGYYGWPQHAPFDAILVTAAASHIPPPLLQQLKPGGRLVIPVGSRFMTQQLVLVSKDEKGNISSRQILPVRFVPLTGGPGTLKEYQGRSE